MSWRKLSSCVGVTGLPLSCSPPAGAFTLRCLWSPLCLHCACHHKRRCHLQGHQSSHQRAMPALITLLTPLPCCCCCLAWASIGLPLPISFRHLSSLCVLLLLTPVPALLPCCHHRCCCHLQGHNPSHQRARARAEGSKRAPVCASRGAQLPAGPGSDEGSGTGAGPAGGGVRPRQQHDRHLCQGH